MSRARELTYLLEDSGATVLVALEALYDEVARDVVAAHRRRGSSSRPASSIYAATTSALFGLGRKRAHEGTLDLAELLDEHRGAGAGRRSSSAPTTSPS